MGADHTDRGERVVVSGVVGMFAAIAGVLLIVLVDRSPRGWNLDVAGGILITAGALGVTAALATSMRRLRAASANRRTPDDRPVAAGSN